MDLSLDSRRMSPAIPLVNFLAGSLERGARESGPAFSTGFRRRCPGSGGCTAIDNQRVAGDKRCGITRQKQRCIGDIFWLPDVRIRL